MTRTHKEYNPRTELVKAPYPLDGSQDPGSFKIVLIFSFGNIVKIFPQIYAQYFFRMIFLRNKITQSRRSKNICHVDGVKRKEIDDVYIGDLYSVLFVVFSAVYI